MSLPFLRPKHQVGVIIKQRNPDGSSQEQASEGNENYAMEAVAEDIIRAVSSKDSKALGAAIRHAFEIMASEGGSEDNSYDSQNAKAAMGAKE